MIGNIITALTLIFCIYLLFAINDSDDELNTVRRLDGRIVKLPNYERNIYIILLILAMIYLLCK